MVRNISKQHNIAMLKGSEKHAVSSAITAVRCEASSVYKQNVKKEKSTQRTGLQQAAHFPTYCDLYL